MGNLASVIPKLLFMALLLSAGSARASDDDRECRRPVTPLILPAAFCGFGALLMGVITSTNECSPLVLSNPVEEANRQEACDRMRTLGGLMAGLGACALLALGADQALRALLGCDKSRQPAPSPSPHPSHDLRADSLSGSTESVGTGEPPVTREASSPLFVPDTVGVWQPPLPQIAPVP